MVNGVAFNSWSAGECVGFSHAEGEFDMSVDLGARAEKELKLGEKIKFKSSAPLGPLLACLHFTDFSLERTFPTSSNLGLNVFVDFEDRLMLGAQPIFVSTGHRMFCPTQTTLTLQKSPPRKVKRAPTHRPKRLALSMSCHAPERVLICRTRRPTFPLHYASIGIWKTHPLQ